MSQSLATATPAEIDTQLAGLDGEQRLAEARRTRALDSLHDIAGDRKTYRGRGRVWTMSHIEAETRAREIAAADRSYFGRRAETALADFEAAEQVIAKIDARAAIYEAEFQRRGGWTRAFLAITNGKGHVHSSTNCPTCNNGQYRTLFGWQPDYSGLNETAIIAAAGYRACTVCYPNAPVGNASTLPTTMFTADELAAAQSRADRAAAKALRDAKKLAAAITADGSDLCIVDGNGHREFFRTERSATTWLVQSLGYHRAYGYSASPAAEKIVIEAIAAKHRKSVDDVTAEIENKVAAWIKRNR